MVDFVFGAAAVAFFGSGTSLTSHDSAPAAGNRWRVRGIDAGDATKCPTVGYVCPEPFG